jgi:hypothetical protein
VCEKKLFFVEEKNCLSGEKVKDVYRLVLSLYSSYFVCHINFIPPSGSKVFRKYDEDFDKEYPQYCPSEWEQGVNC